MFTLMLCLLIQSGFSFGLPQPVHYSTETRDCDCDTNDTDNQPPQKNFEDFTRDYIDEETEARKKIKELDHTLKQILSKSHATRTEADDYGDIAFFLRSVFKSWFDNIWKKRLTTTTTEQPTISKLKVGGLGSKKVNGTNEVKYETSLSKVLDKLSRSLDGLSKILVDKKPHDDFICARIPHNFEDATRSVQRNKRQAESTESKNSQNYTSPFRLYYLRKNNKTLQNDTKAHDVNLKNKHLEEVRDKLYAYVDDKFNEVTKKAEPLQNLRNDLGENSGFKLGYVIANLDVLIENIKKLKADIDEKRENFKEDLFLDALNKFKSAFKVVDNIEMAVHKSLSDLKL